MTENNILNKTFDFILKKEGSETSLHSDPVGIPTIGAGFALITADKNVIKQGDINKALSDATEGRVQISDKDYAKLTDVAEALKTGNKEKAKEITRTMNKLELGREGRDKLLKNEIDFRYQNATNKLRSYAKTPEEKANVEKFINSDAMVGALSVKYNVGATPKMDNAIIKGDKAGVLYEIEYGSNKNKSQGIANRRAEEANFVRETMTSEEKQRFEGLRKENYETIKEQDNLYKRSENYPVPERKPDITNLEPQANNFMPTKEDEAQTSAVKENKFYKLFQDLIEPSEKMLARNPKEMTKAELNEAMMFVSNYPHHPQRQKVDDHVKDYFNVRYSGDAEYDATGRMIDPVSTIKEPEAPSPIRDKKGISIDDGLEHISFKWSHYDNAKKL